MHANVFLEYLKLHCTIHKWIFICQNIFSVRLIYISYCQFQSNKWRTFQFSCLLILWKICTPLLPQHKVNTEESCRECNALHDDNVLLYPCKKCLVNSLCKLSKRSAFLRTVQEERKRIGPINLLSCNT